MPLWQQSAMSFAPMEADSPARRHLVTASLPAVTGQVA
jgi:hypothetical protein